MRVLLLENVLSQMSHRYFLTFEDRIVGPEGVPPEEEQEDLVLFTETSLFKEGIPLAKEITPLYKLQVIILAKPSRHRHLQSKVLKV